MNERETQFRLQRAPDGVMHIARDMRKDMTPAEVCLWNAIRNRKLSGFKFRAQHPVERFILDFYCPAARLGVELDGAVHEKNRGYDAARDEFLLQHGYRIIRFQNAEVFENLSSVCERILQAIEEELPPAP